MRLDSRLIEGCAHVPAQILYARGETCNNPAVLDPSRTLPALRAEENVVCNLNSSVAYLDSCRHFYQELVC